MPDDLRVTQLYVALPPVTLLLGPEHSGKKTLANSLLIHHARVLLDRLWVKHLSLDAGQQIQRFCQTAPFGRLKVVVIALTGATSAALNRMLKLLEEPPDTVRFILIARKEPLATIRSRSQVVVCAPQPEDAEQISRARSAALAALKSALSGDSSLLSMALKNWSAEDSSMLSRWCLEKMSGKWRTFDPLDSKASRKFAQRLHAALDANRMARPRLAARTALEVAARMEN